MKKMLLPLLGIMFAASLSHGTFTKSTVHADCASLLHGVPHAGDGSTQDAITTDSEGAGMATTTTESAQQIEEQGVSFPDRMLNLLDSFGRLVMVI